MKSNQPYLVLFEQELHTLREATHGFILGLEHVTKVQIDIADCVAQIFESE